MDPEELQLDEKHRSTKRIELRDKTTLTVGVLGWLIASSSITAILFNSLPLQLASPEWQLNLIGALLNASSTLLIAASMIALSHLLNPQDKILSRWAAAASKLASWYVIALVAFIPLQFFLGTRIMKTQEQAMVKPLNELKTISGKIKTINSEADLRAYLASLPNPPSLPAKFDADFPVIKQRAIDNIQAKINAGHNTLELQASQQKQIFFKEAVRNTAQLILMAAGFSAVANLSSKARNFITDIFSGLL